MNYPNQNLLYRNFAFCLLFFVPLVLLPKGTLVQEINLFEYLSLIPFFKWIKLLGDGWILLLVFISLLAYYFHSKTSMSRDNLMNFLFSS